LLERVDSTSWTGVTLCLCLLPPLIWIGNPAWGLLAGGTLALATNRRPFEATGTLTTYSLQAAIVLLGFRLDLNTLVTLSAEYAVAVAAYVLSTLALGLTVGRMLGLEAPSSKLLSAGTAICGGTAIATLSTVVRAEPQQTSVALAIVFLLNVVALLTFPWIGHALELSQVEFGLWAALAIHDTSSVVATAAIYGEAAAEVATTIKLGRTLWLIPLVFVMAVVEQRNHSDDGGGRPMPRLRVPGFVLMFVAAAAVGSILELPDAVAATAGTLSKWLLVVALFLVGTELTRGTLRRIRGRVLGHALALWLVVVPATLGAVMWLA
jgi:uncharacterized integral membrane protein (TIGR00698 family)